MLPHTKPFLNSNPQLWGLRTHCKGMRTLSFQAACPLIGGISYMGLSSDLHTLVSERVCAEHEKHLMDSLRISNSHFEWGCLRTAREFLQWGIMWKPWQKKLSVGIQLAIWCAAEFPCTKLSYLGNVRTVYSLLWVYLHTLKRELLGKLKFNAT